MAKKILLVDDSKSARYAIGLLLKKQGYEVINAGSGEQALESLREAKPDAIFLDHQLPGMNGLDLLLELKQKTETKSIPVVMCTSNDNESYIAEAVDKGALDVLSKPDAPKRISDIARKLNSLLDDGPRAARSSFDEPKLSVQPETPAEQSSPGMSQLELDMAIATSVQSHVEPMINQRLRDFLEEIRPMVEKYALESLAHELSIKDIQMRDELTKLVKERSQAAAQIIEQETVPSVVQKAVGLQTEQLTQRLDKRFQALIPETVKALPGDEMVVKMIKQYSEKVATARADLVARKRAEEIAEHIAGEKVAVLTGHTAELQQELEKKFYPLLAIAAIGGALLALAVGWLIF